jgi:hypothetical protein
VKKRGTFAKKEKRFFRVDESFRAGTRAGLTRARSLNTWFNQNKTAVKN